MAYDAPPESDRRTARSVSIGGRQPAWRNEEPSSGLHPRHPQPKYQPVKLIEPPLLGYIHVGAAVAPPAGRIPRPGSSPDKKALLARLKDLRHQLETLPEVVRATVYRGILIPPPGGYAKQATHPARYDVAVLVETTAPEVIGEVQTSEPYKLLLEAAQEAATDLHIMAARGIKRVGDVDKTRQGLFLFNYFVAEDAQVALRLWDHLAGWYAVETGMDNSTLLAPIGDADYVFINHLRWNYSLPRLMVRQFAKPSFRSYVLANLRANRTGSMPLLYRLA